MKTGGKNAKKKKIQSQKERRKRVIQIYCRNNDLKLGKVGGQIPYRLKKLNQSETG